MTITTTPDFDARFAALTGNRPFPWQRTLYKRLLSGRLPERCDIPTGLGKTSVIAVWLLARAAGASLPRRLVYVVNRRTVVDQTTVEVSRLRERLAAAGIEEHLAVSTLRGGTSDNRAWSEDPSCPAVICGTVDMIGSRLLFSGYRIGWKSRPLHAGFLGQDALLVHDEAHLEPAFQKLIESVVDEQKRAGDRWPLRIMALTATTRSHASLSVEDGDLRLTNEDRADPVVAQRIEATKRLFLHVHGERDLVDKVVAQVSMYKDSGAAVLVFLRTVEDLGNAVARLRKVGFDPQQLTGTMRGYERDQLVASDPIFARFLVGGGTATAASGTVVLLSTSAGEVGVNLSADHLVCDLSTFDAMAQRFGRVNRFGMRTDSEVHVFHPEPQSLIAKKQQAQIDSEDADDAVSPDDSVDLRRSRTLALLRTLEGNASPLALSALDPAARIAAFAPQPRMLPATDILFDTWAMTTIRRAMPGRPPVSAYLHGVSDWEPPTVQIAWRQEVDLLTTEELRERYRPEDLLEDYPLKPHELLADRAKRVAAILAEASAARATTASSPVWVIREDGSVRVTTVGELVDGDLKRVADDIASSTLLLSANQSRPIGGLLSAASWDSAVPPDAHAPSADVADEWRTEHGAPRRQRLFDGSRSPTGMRLIRTLVLREDNDDADDDSEPTTPALRWSWYELPHGADNEGSRTATRPVLLDVHSADVERVARGIVERLPIDDGVKRAIVLAAKHHDQGKNRRVWQRSIGNPDHTRLFAKSGAPMRPLDLTLYRHELGSMLDAERELLADLDPDNRELALHLIAAHHGRARPHFPTDELFDPEVRGVDLRDEGTRVMLRFARLQRRFGRWGLAYLESLVRAADYAASADPSQVEEL